MLINTLALYFTPIFTTSLHVDDSMIPIMMKMNIVNNVSTYWDEAVVNMPLNVMHDNTYFCLSYFSVVFIFNNIRRLIYETIKGGPNDYSTYMYNQVLLLYIDQASRTPNYARSLY